MVWTLFILTGMVLMFENLLDFRSFKRLKRDHKRKQCLRRLLRRHALMAAFFAWGAVILRILEPNTFLALLGVLGVGFISVEIGIENNLLRGMEKVGWMLLMAALAGVSGVLFFEVMAPWLLILMTVGGFFLMVILFDRYHARMIERLTRVVPYFHRMDDAGFLAGLAFSERAYMLDIKALRSVKNAMIVGLFAPRRLYVSKAMLKSMRPSEVEAIIAHEVGHIRYGHILKRLLFAFIALMMFIGTGLLVFRYNYPTYIAYTMLFTGWFLIGVLARSTLALLMQGQEYEADRYAFEAGKALDLTSALKRLGRQEEEHGYHLRALLHETHPPIEKRMERLQKMNKAQ